MAEVTIVTCICNARGDEGEMVEHVISHLTDPDDSHTHGLANEPEQVTAVRNQAAERTEYRRKLAEAAGLTLEQLQLAQSNG